MKSIVCLALDGGDALTLEVHDPFGSILFVFSRNCLYLLSSFLYSTKSSRSTYQTAYYLDIKPLVDLTCRVIAWMVRGKSSQEIRNTFQILPDRVSSSHSLIFNMSNFVSHIFDPLGAFFLDHSLTQKEEREKNYL